MRPNWSKQEITKLEAMKLLDHAAECIDYVNKTLRSQDRPAYPWMDFMQQSLTTLAALHGWLRVDRGRNATK